MEIERLRVDGDNETVMRVTLAKIGEAIRAGSQYLPLRNYAAAVASTAGPKDYLGQVQAIYDRFVRSWRYVKDPVSRELVSYSPEALYKLVIGADGRGAGEGRGVGDCDCATAAIGAQLEAIGMPVRLATTADRHALSGSLFGHVFAQTLVPKLGWVTVDPVLYPARPFGAIAPHSRIAIWDLEGRMIGARGNYKPKKKVEVYQWENTIKGVFRVLQACRRMTAY